MKKTNATAVEIDQVWADNDPRVRRGEIPKRTLKVHALPHPSDTVQAAKCFCIETQTFVKIRIDRLLKGTAYKLISP